MNKELIERLRLMSADTIGNGAADALESLEADRDSWERQAGDRLDDVLRVVAERDALAAELNALREQEPVSHEFQAQDGSWRGFINESHYKNTVEDGSWPIRALYAHPVPARELTDEAIENLHMQIYKGPSIAPVRMLSFARAIERYLKGEGE